MRESASLARKALLPLRGPGRLGLYLSETCPTDSAPRWLIWTISGLGGRDVGCRYHDVASGVGQEFRSCFFAFEQVDSAVVKDGKFWFPATIPMLLNDIDHIVPGIDRTIPVRIGQKACLLCRARE